MVIFSSSERNYKVVKCRKLYILIEFQFLYFILTTIYCSLLCTYFIKNIQKIWGLVSDLFESLFTMAFRICAIVHYVSSCSMGSSAVDRLRRKNDIISEMKISPNTTAIISVPVSPTIWTEARPSCALVNERINLDVVFASTVRFFTISSATCSAAARTSGAEMTVMLMHTIVLVAWTQVEQAKYTSVELVSWHSGGFPVHVPLFTLQCLLWLPPRWSYDVRQLDLATSPVVSDATSNTAPSPVSRIRHACWHTGGEPDHTGLPPMTSQYLVRFPLIILYPSLHV